MLSESKWKPEAQPGDAEVNHVLNTNSQRFCVFSGTDPTSSIMNPSDSHLHNEGDLSVDDKPERIDNGVAIAMLHCLVRRNATG